ncbi:zinc ribbon domain-containing protein [Pectobacterium fontis]|uniref:Primosomal protein N' (Replication factor Y)-superfamily II helicase n=1 Tax=Pectobacterium fontis TaxID=2558042 RepID=A0A7V8L418_9GAMM|nr:zinc ribbon domain-containing protein [Pectobacterium fontis]KHN49856.1 hypothetical protein OI69_16630 [Pectobacterium fontis]
MDTRCPDCHHVMLWQPDGLFRCEECQQHYQREAVCPECKHLLQELKACGAVDYFCQQHGMISRRQVVFSYSPAD